MPMVGSPGLNWRRPYDDLSYLAMDTPPDVAEGVRGCLTEFGLTYGAFDFGLDTRGMWHVYECNPHGQYAWFPGCITGQITAAIAEQLQHFDRERR
ncbi:hypothetical protein [Streptomyces asoensis]|uniref:hypothetical protein n=1 Tax=Streptomyces asoensis TaxID=249586 RepID=UPI0033ECC9A6